MSRAATDGVTKLRKNTYPTRGPRRGAITEVAETVGMVTGRLVRVADLVSPARRVRQVRLTTTPAVLGPKMVSISPVRRRSGTALLLMVSR